MIALFLRMVRAAWPMFLAFVWWRLPIPRSKPTIDLHQIGYGLFRSQTHSRSEHWLKESGLVGKWVTIEGPVEAVVSMWWGVMVDVRARVTDPTEFFPYRCLFRSFRLDKVRMLHRYNDVVLTGQIRRIGRDFVLDGLGKPLFYPIVVDFCEMKDIRDSRPERYRGDDL